MRSSCIGVTFSVRTQARFENKTLAISGRFSVIMVGVFDDEGLAVGEDYLHVWAEVRPLLGDTPGLTTSVTLTVARIGFLVFVS